MSRKSPSDPVRRDEIGVQYARLVALSQAAEQSIALFVSFANAASGSGDLKPSFDDLLAETRRKTLGQLCRSLVSTLKQLAPEHPPPETLAGVLAELLQARNWLAHRYFLDRQMLIDDPNQHRLLIEELQLLTQHFLASIRLLQPFANIMKAVASAGLGGLSFDLNAFMRQRLFEEYGNIQVSLRKLRAKPPFGLSA